MKESIMKKIIIAAAVGMLVAGQVAAQESPWLVRARAVGMHMANENSTPVNGLGVQNKTIPEVDISYFFNKNVAAELILSVPQQVTVVSSSGDVGTFKALPPTLTLQYHFTDLGAYKPYVGAGLNYTKISKMDLGQYSLDNHSYGFALQAGVDVPLTKQVSLNFDVKKIQMRSDVYAGSTKAGTLKLDPTLVGVGVGYRF
jgi:outer membrane protein